MLVGQNKAFKVEHESSFLNLETAVLTKTILSQSLRKSFFLPHLTDFWKLWEKLVSGHCEVVIVKDFFGSKKQAFFICHFLRFCRLNDSSENREMGWKWSGIFQYFLTFCSVMIHQTFWHASKLILYNLTQIAPKIVLHPLWLGAFSHACYGVSLLSSTSKLIKACIDALGWWQFTHGLITWSVNSSPSSRRCLSVVLKWCSLSAVDIWSGTHMQAWHRQTFVKQMIRRCQQ